MACVICTLNYKDDDMSERFNSCSNKERISGVTISICLYIMLMMLQTPVMRIGMMTAFSTIIIVILACVFSGKQALERFVMTNGSGVLVIFAFHLFITTIAQNGIQMEMLEVLAMLIVTVFLCGIQVTDKEDNAIRWALILAVTVYAILTIRSCVANQAMRYYHGGIRLFGTEFDPNYIGIPFVAATVLLIENMLRGRRVVISGVCYGVIAVAIVYTASRGNMITWGVSNAMVMFFFLKDRSVTIGKKFFWCMAAIVLLIILVVMLSSNFEQQWTRMTIIEEGSDNGRFDLWETSLGVWKRNPIFGVGYNGMLKSAGAVSHNTYLQILTETGILGFCLLLIFAFQLLINTFRSNRSCFCVLLALFIQIMFLDTLSSRCLWAIIGWCVLQRDETMKK